MYALLQGAKLRFRPPSSWNSMLASMHYRIPHAWPETILLSTSPAMVILLFRLNLTPAIHAFGQSQALHKAMPVLRLNTRSCCIQ